MRRFSLRSRALAALALLIFPVAAWAQTETVVADTFFLPPAPVAPTVAPTAGNALNPNLSVIAWLQATAGSPRVSAPAFQEREAEIGLQSVVDPYARADFFLSASEAGLDVEEGYLTFTSLPEGLGLKVGKFRNKFGKFNTTHAGETPFADRPLIAQALFGEEGLSSTGLSASYLLPGLPFYLSLETEITSPNPGREGLFARSEDRKQLLGLGRMNAFFDVGEASNLNLSVSGASGPAGDAAGITTGRPRVFGVETTFRWKNPRRAIYKSLVWQTEAYLSRVAPEIEGVTTVALSPPEVLQRHGFFSYLDYQFSRRMHAGARFDYAQAPAGVKQHEAGQLGFLTFQPSEFMLISTQVRHVRDFALEDQWNGFLKLTFNIGPHGAHPF